MQDSICRICHENNLGPSMVAKMRPNLMCDTCFHHPKGTTVASLIEEKKITVTPNGWAFTPNSIPPGIIEYE